MTIPFTLRPWQITDAASLAKYANNASIAKNLTDAFPHPYGMENALAFIKMASASDPVTIFAIEINGEACGGIGLHPQHDIHRMNAELGYWLAEPYWGHGIITQAILQIVDFGFKTLPVDRIFARPFGSNQGSQKALEKAGFVLEARLKNTLFKNGKYEDELIYAVRR